MIRNALLQFLQRAQTLRIFMEKIITGKKAKENTTTKMMTTMTKTRKNCMNIISMKMVKLNNDASTQQQKRNLRNGKMENVAQ